MNAEDRKVEAGGQAVEVVPPGKAGEAMGRYADKFRKTLSVDFRLQAEGERWNHIVKARTAENPDKPMKSGETRNELKDAALQTGSGDEISARNELYGALDEVDAVIGEEMIKRGQDGHKGWFFKELNRIAEVTEKDGSQTETVKALVGHFVKGKIDAYKFGNALAELGPRDEIEAAALLTIGIRLRNKDLVNQAFGMHDEWVEKNKSGATTNPEAPEAREGIAVTSETKGKNDPYNEDSLVVDENKRIYAVFDGMGGHASADKASGRAAEELSKWEIPQNLTAEEIKALLENKLREINQSILVEANGDERGCTASVVHIVEGANGERKAVIANAGDSRVYLFREGQLEALTLDDARMVHELKMTREGLGKFSKDDLLKMQTAIGNLTDIPSYDKDNPNTDKLNDEQKDKLREIFAGTSLSLETMHAIVSDNTGIENSLGGSTVEPGVSVMDLKVDDVLFMCSDGVTDNLTHAEIEDLLKQGKTASEVVAIARQSYESGRPGKSKKDDISGIVIKMGKKEGADSTGVDAEADGSSATEAGETPKYPDVPRLEDNREMQADLFVRGVLVDSWLKYADSLSDEQKENLLKNAGVDVQGAKAVLENERGYCSNILVLLANRQPILIDMEGVEKDKATEESEKLKKLIENNPQEAERQFNAFIKENQELNKFPIAKEARDLSSKYGTLVQESEWIKLVGAEQYNRVQEEVKRDYGDLSEDELKGKRLEYAIKSIQGESQQDRVLRFLRAGLLEKQLVAKSEQSGVQIKKPDNVSEAWTRYRELVKKGDTNTTEDIVEERVLKDYLLSLDEGQWKMSNVEIENLLVSIQQNSEIESELAKRPEVARARVFCIGNMEHLMRMAARSDQGEFNLGETAEGEPPTQADIDAATDDGIRAMGGNPSAMREFWNKHQDTIKKLPKYGLIGVGVTGAVFASIGIFWLLFYYSLGIAAAKGFMDGLK